MISLADDGSALIREVAHINAYLVPGVQAAVEPRPAPFADLHPMSFGSMPNDGGNLLLTRQEVEDAIRRHGVDADFIRPFLGSQEFIRGQERRCIWFTRINLNTRGGTIG